MATTELTTGPASAGEKLQHFAATALARAASMLQAVRNRRSVAKLLEWDDRMLRDIGLTQSDVRSAMSAPISDDPSYRLGVMSSERRAAFRAQARELSVREFRLESRSDLWKRKPGSSGAA